MRIGAAQRQLSRTNGERISAPSYSRFTRIGWIRRFRDTVLHKGALVWCDDDDGSWWLGKASASATEDGLLLVRGLDDAGPIKLPLPPARHTTSKGAVQGPRFIEVQVTNAFSRGIQRNVD